LKALVFLGSRRKSSPPLPARLGERVSLHLAARMGEWFDVTLVDPLDYPPTNVFKPAFAYGDRAKPEPFAGLEAMIREAGAYAMVSPEYNHSMSPALGDLLNHFPSSAFAFKPSLIATYSSGQWGGTRAAVNMRTFLSELGCLPVSAMLHFPHADQVFEADGQFHPEQDAGKWKTYVDRGVGQLQWWADAADRHRGILDPAGVSKAFSKTPAERDSPGR